MNGRPEKPSRISIGWYNEDEAAVVPIKDADSEHPHYVRLRSSKGLEVQIPSRLLKNPFTKWPRAIADWVLEKLGIGKRKSGGKDGNEGGDTEDNGDADG